MNDQTAAHDAVFAGQGNAFHEDIQLGLTIGVGFQGRQIADVVGIGRFAVRLLQGIEVSAGAGGVRGAAIAFLVNVEAVRTGRESAEFASDPDALRFLRERDATLGSIALCGRELGKSLRAGSIRAGASGEEKRSGNGNESLFH